MSVSEAETTAHDDATPSPDAGKEVWCPEGCGNRILEPNERIGFPCPACSMPMVEEKPEAMMGKTRKERLPELGRIVHVLIAEGVVRPAIVAGRSEDGRCLVHIFKHEHDPLPSGLRGESAVLSYGSTIGQWHWPPKSEAEHFLTPDE